MKRKTLSLTLCLLTCLALIGVGFAAWLITYDGTKSIDGNIVVETVNTQNYVITVTPDVQAEIRFTPKKNDAIANPWLTYNTAEDKQEKLSASFTVTVKFDSSYDADDKDKIQLNLPGESANSTLPTISSEISISAGNEKWEAAKTNEVVKRDLTTTWALKSSSSEEYTYTVTVTGEWGNHFDYQNPYDFYNSKASASAFKNGESGTTWGEDAATYLGYVADLASVKFTLTIKVVAPTNA